jgi:nicotinate-nucleotide adenylyltransferase
MQRVTQPICRVGLPKARAGQAIGLLGGSFDPPHEGHAHITRQALRRFGLDRVWWLVSPGNPLKLQGPAPLQRRLAASRAVMQHPKVEISDIEARLGTRHTALTLRALRRLYPGVKFVWLMGADNLASFHKWDQWRQIMTTVPVAVLARPGDRTTARHAPVAKSFKFAQLRGRDAKFLPSSPPPCWCFINVPMVNVSSSAIRARGDWVR